MSDWNAQLTQYQGWIEDYLTERCFVYDSEPQQKLFEAMRYSCLLYTSPWRLLDKVCC